MRCLDPGTVSFEDPVYQISHYYYSNYYLYLDIVVPVGSHTNQQPAAAQRMSPLGVLGFLLLCLQPAAPAVGLTAVALDLSVHG